MHLTCCNGLCFLRIHVKNILKIMGNAESNMLKGFIQVYLFATTKKKSFATVLY